MPTTVEKEAPETFRQNRLLSFEEAREFFGVGKGKFYQMISAKKDPVPSIKIGKLYKFQLDKLLWWVEKHEQ